MKYERLTIRNSDGSVSQPTHSTFEKVFNRLAELEDKIEQGTLIEFPRIVKTKRLDVKYYVECKNKFYGGIIDCYEYDTREEAEKRLKELQNG